jgi:hypothetical protein
VIARGMTPRGKQIAAFFGIALAMSLPKRVPCERPGRTCSVLGPDQRACRPTDMEPFGVYLLELVTGRDLPIAYSTDLDCD